LAHRIIEAERTEHHRLKHGRDLMTLRGALAGMTDPAIHGSSSTGDPVIQSLSQVVQPDRRLRRRRWPCFSARPPVERLHRHGRQQQRCVYFPGKPSFSSAARARSPRNHRQRSAAAACRARGAPVCLPTGVRAQGVPGVGPRAVPAIMRRAACRRPPVPRLGPPFPVGENRARPRENASTGHGGRNARSLRWPPPCRGAGRTDSRFRATAAGADR